MPIHAMSRQSLYYLLRRICKKFSFQVEKGEETGYLHYQIAISLIKKLRWESVCELFPESHVEGAINKFAVENYCVKRSTRVEGPWNQDSKMIKDGFLEFEPYKWQLDVLETLKNEPDDRTIHWYYSKLRGKLGKTLLAKHICIENHKAIYVNGKGADIKAAIVKMKEPPEVVIFGFPKSSEEYVNYGAIEEVKDGIFFSGKYESEMMMFDNPHVLVFANFKPDVKKMMEDRWHIVNIDVNDEEVSQDETFSIE